MKTYIKPDFEIIDMEPFMAGEGVGVNDLSGDRWTFTNKGTFDEEEESGSENNSIIWE